MAKKKTFGKLPPRYSFILNPHKGTRLSKCPKCNKLTYPRKFAFVIHIDQPGLLMQGKTCKYCPRCELIMMHQDELENELAHKLGKKAPAVTGNWYLVLGTIDKKIWEQGMKGQMPGLDTIIQHTADFKKVPGLDFEPGGWYFDDE